MIKNNVLIFPAGGENALNLYRSLRYNIHFNIFGATSINSYVKILYPEGHYEENSDYYTKSSNFFIAFNNMINKFNIKFILPTLDDIAVFLTKNADKINAKIVCSPYETAKIALEKKLTFKAIAGESYAPKIFENIEDISSYPVFVKPNIGAGSRGVKIINSKSELNKIFEDDVICEYLPGEEYTVDCFTNSKGELLFSGARTRENIKNGIAWGSAEVENENEFTKIAKSLNSKLKFCGLWFFQVKRDISGNLKLMEFSVRAAGTMIYFRQLGINFASLALFDAMGNDIVILKNNVKLRLYRSIHDNFILNYNYNYVYFDLDDTLTVSGKVNTEAIKFLYQAFNAGKKIILLTKHEKDIFDTLENYRISAKLFDEIIHISPDKIKADYIDKTDAIFVDNYFPDRKAVFEKCNIPVFDVDAIQCLILERGF